MKPIRSLLLLALAMVCSVALHADRKSFERTWKGRTVTLTQPLYTIVMEKRTEGVTVVTPDRGVFYGGYFGYGDVQRDRDPQALLAKVQALFGKAAEPRLLTFAAGTTLIVTNVRVAARFQRHRVWFGLADPLAPKQEATDLTVELPHDITEADFAQVEQLAETFFR